MIPWRNRLEVRILALSVILPLAGVMAISVGVLFFLESGIVDMVRIHSEASSPSPVTQLERKAHKATDHRHALATEVWEDRLDAQPD